MQQQETPTTKPDMLWLFGIIVWMVLNWPLGISVGIMAVVMTFFGTTCALFTSYSFMGRFLPDALVLFVLYAIAVAGFAALCWLSEALETRYGFSADALGQFTMFMILAWIAPFLVGCGMQLYTLLEPTGMPALGAFCTIAPVLLFGGTAFVAERIDDYYDYRSRRIS